MDFYYTDATNQARGPVTLAELQELAAAGHVTPQTMVAAVGAQQWVPISVVLPAMGPLPITVAPTEPLAIWSMVLGCISLVCCFGVITGIPAVICGHLALSAIKKKSFVQGRGLAIAGLVMGYFICAVSVLYFATIAIVAITDAAQHHH